MTISAMKVTAVPSITPTASGKRASCKPPELCSSLSPAPMSIVFSPSAALKRGALRGHGAMGMLQAPSSIQTPQYRCRAPLGVDAGCMLVAGCLRRLFVVTVRRMRGAWIYAVVRLVPAQACREAGGSGCSARLFAHGDDWRTCAHGGRAPQSPPRDRRDEPGGPPSIIAPAFPPRGVLAAALPTHHPPST